MERSNETYSKVCEGVLIFNGDTIPPSNIEIDGKSYKRFHDYIYLDRPAENLTEKQVAAVCRLREDHPEWLDEASANSQVHRLFSEIILNYCPESVFEVGPGAFPLFSSDQQAFRYIQGDLDERIVDKNIGAGYDIVKFDLNSELPFHNNSIEMVVGVFVLQFEFTVNQVREIKRVLKRDGVFLANVYHRTDEAKKSLKNCLEKEGLIVTVFPDLKKLCKKNQYWIISKSTSGRLHDHCRDALT